MSYIELARQIKPFTESISYSNFYSELSNITVNSLQKANDHLRDIGRFSYNKNLNESIDDVSSKYNENIKDDCDKVVDMYDKMLASEYNRLYTKTVGLQNIIDTNKKKIITSQLNNNDEIVLYEKFFNPNVDILSVMLADPQKDSITQLMGIKTKFESKDLSCKQSDLIAIIPKIQTQLIENRNKLSQLVQRTGFTNFNLDDLFELKDSCKKYIDAFKSVNMAYDECLQLVESLIKKYLESPTSVSCDSITNKIDQEQIYDASGINECFDSINTKIKSVNIILENVAIKYNIETMTEASNGADNKSKNKSRFRTIIDAIIKAAMTIIEFIRDKWIKIRKAAAQVIDRYGRWINRHEEEILKTINKFKSYECTISEWNWDGRKLDLSGLSNAIKTMLPHRSIGSPIEEYERALKHFQQYTSGDFERNIYNMVLQKNFGIKTSVDVSINTLWDNILKKYRKEPTKKRIIDIDVKKYINILKNSKKKLAELNSADIMSTINDESKILVKEMNTVKSLFDTERYTVQEYNTVMKYYTAKKKILSVAKSVANRTYEINFKLIQESTHEAYKALKYLINNNLNETINFSSNEYIEMANLFENCYDVCMNSDLTQGGVFSKDVNINKLVDKTIPEEIMNKILSLKLYCICKMNDGSILMKSDIDKTVWVYNPNDQTLICQNTLNGVYNACN